MLVFVLILRHATYAGGKNKGQGPSGGGGRAGNHQPRGGGAQRGGVVQKLGAAVNQAAASVSSELVNFLFPVRQQGGRQKNEEGRIPNCSNPFDPLASFEIVENSCALRGTLRFVRNYHCMHVEVAQCANLNGCKTDETLRMNNVFHGNATLTSYMQDWHLNATNGLLDKTIMTNALVHLGRTDPKNDSTLNELGNRMNVRVRVYIKNVRSCTTPSFTQGYKPPPVRPSHYLRKIGSFGLRSAGLTSWVAHEVRYRVVPTGHVTRLARKATPAAVFSWTCQFS